jgi:flagellar motor switch protein FliN/FliY
MAEETKISQDEIDRLLAGAAGAGGGGAAATAPASGTSPEIDALLEEAGKLSAAAAAGAKPFDLPSLAESGGAASGEVAIDLLRDVDLDVKVVLGRSQMYVEDILKLRSGSVIELDKLAGDPLDILVNDRLVARGEVLVLNDNFCIRITEIVDPTALEEAKG